MDWTGYELFDPGVDGPLARVSLEQARMHFDKLMAEREERKAQLAALLARDAIPLGGTTPRSPRWTTGSATGWRRVPESPS